MNTMARFWRSIFALALGVQASAQTAGPQSLPSLRSPLWAPLPEPTIKTGMAAMCAAVLELMPPPKR
jgi:hypothetical protein